MNEYFVLLWGLLQAKLLAFAILVALDIVFGTVAALYLKKFKWEYLMHFVNSDLIPIFVWIGAVVLSTIPQELVPEKAVIIGSDLIYGAVFLGILSSILGSWKDLGVLNGLLDKIGIGKINEPKG